MDWNTVLEIILTIAIPLIFTLLGYLIRSLIEEKFTQDRIRFSKLHENRAKIIAELYAKLVELEKQMKDLVSGSIINKDEKAEETRKSCNRFIDFYAKNEIYFNKKISGSLYRINATFREIWNATPTNDLNNAASPQQKQQWRVDANKKLYNEIPKLKEELKKEFHKILGVKN
ncbi:MAG: hypothetical protein KAT28_00895 [Candidatus Aenigmarchaeota archaeon]|nr:hypothetical protein [Candidatus Aenigmarchaeota archaeon]